MRLILMRHAEAVPLGVDGASTDELRQLTEYGQATADAFAAFVTAKAIPIQCVISSGLMRATQTVEPLRLVLGLDLLILPDFAPEGHKPKRIADKLDELNADIVLVCGHMPSLGHYAQWLLGLPQPIHFSKGAALGLKCRGGVRADQAALEWFLPPEHYLTATS